MANKSSLQPSIIRRLNAALEDMRAEGLEPKHFYLTESDRLAFDKAASKDWGGKVHAFSHRDVQMLKRELAPDGLPSRQAGYSVLTAATGETRRILRRAAS